MILPDLQARRKKAKAKLRAVLEPTRAKPKVPISNCLDGLRIQNIQITDKIIVTHGISVALYFNIVDSIPIFGVSQWNVGTSTTSNNFTSRVNFLMR